MIIKEQKPIQLVNNCNAIYCEQDVIDAVLWYTDKPVYRIKRITLHGRYPSISIYYEKVHLHRILKSWQLGRRLGRKEYVHHNDENVLNCKLDNLDVMQASSHQSFHAKGKILSEQHKDKIGIANHKRKGIKIKRRINISLVELKSKLIEGWSINKIAKHYGCDWTTVKARIDENPEMLKVKK